MKTFFSFMFKKVRISLEFKLQDMWVGGYWHSEWSLSHGDDKKMKVKNLPHLGGKVNVQRVVLDVWICLLPTLPIHFHWVREDSLLF